MRSMQTILCLLAAGVLFGGQAARAIARPDVPTGAAAKVPNLLTDYERRYLRIEARNLMNEISAARAACGDDPSLAELKAAPRQLELSGASPAEVNAAKQKFSDARETLLYKREGIPEKIKRLQEVGAYLEYDTRQRKEERAKTPEVRFKRADSAQPSAVAAQPNAEAAQPEEATRP